MLGALPRLEAPPATIDEFAEAAAEPGDRDLALRHEGRQQLRPLALIAIETPGLDQLGAGIFVVQRPCGSAPRCKRISMRPSNGPRNRVFATMLALLSPRRFIGAGLRANDGPANGTKRSELQYRYRNRLRRISMNVIRAPAILAFAVLTALAACRPELSDEADQDHRLDLGRRHHRPRRPHPRRPHHRQDRPAGGDRQPRRRQRQHRHGRGRQGGARRLHARRRQHRQHRHQSVSDAAHAVRPAQRPGAGRGDRNGAAVPGHERQRAGRRRCRSSSPTPRRSRTRSAMRRPASARRPTSRRTNSTAAPD